jgi:hypothetical protein
MWSPLLVNAVLVAEKDQLEIRQFLPRNITVLKTAIHRAEELQRWEASAPRNEDDEPSGEACAKP